MLKKLLGSRKFVTAVVAVGASLVTAIWGKELGAELQAKIVGAIVLLSSLYIGGTALEDSAAKLAGKKK